MADNDGIGPVGATHFGAGQGGGHYGHGGAGRESERPPERPRDAVELTQPRRVILHLMRQRVLEATRRALGLPPQCLQAHQFAASPCEDPAHWVGRLISDQNRLAAQARGQGELQVAAAVEAGMTHGLSEALELIEEAGNLDDAAWELIRVVLHELHRKLAAAIRHP